MAGRYAAVDLGASSGRVVVGHASADRLELEEVHRFANGPVRLPEGLHWDVLGLWRDTLVGLRLATSAADPLVSIGVDSWAIDHAFLDAQGRLLGNPWHHRDSRTDGVADRLWATLPPDELYRINGLQHLPFTSVYQLMASQGSAAYEAATRVLLLPDLLVYWLTGIEGTEHTNASTTGLLDATTGDWSDVILSAAGIERDLLASLREPGQPVGPVLGVIRAEVGVSPATRVTLIGSHDTASAVAAVPARGRAWAYIACGTWALAGVELSKPVLSEESRTANFTNEAGLDGTVRYLRNVMGLWVLSETLRTWAAQGRAVDLADLLAEAATLPPGGPVIDIDDHLLLPPGDMPTRITQMCRRTDQPEPFGQAAMVRCILDSLASAFARALADAERLSGQQIEVIHLVGGGARNQLLCRLTAEATGRTVLAGPVEATALGNVLVQARAVGDLPGGLEELRDLVRRTHSLERYEPGT